MDQPVVAAQAAEAGTSKDMSSEPYKVKFTVKVGEGEPEKYFIVMIHPEWAPLGAQRFKELMDVDYFKDCRFHRVVDGFMVQFGLAADPKLYAEWGAARFKDDPVTQSNTTGRLSFANRGPDSRSVQIFINTADNASLDEQFFSPFAEVIEGMELIKQFYGGYGDYPPKGSGPDPERIKAEGLSYLKGFPKLSFIEKTEVI